MATPEQIPTDLTLEIGVDLTPEAFLAASRHFFGLAKEISEASGAINMKWRVQVREGSNLIGLIPDEVSAADQVAAIYDKFGNSAACLMQGRVDEAELPEPALNHYRQLAQLTESKKNPVSMKLWIKRSPVEMGPKIAEAIREDWRTEYADYGSFDGRLQAIQEQGGNLRIKIKDPLFRRPIDCSIPEALINEALSTFRKRVEVSGLVKYRKTGIPVSISVDHIEVMPEDDELPDANDVRGILAVG